MTLFKRGQKGFTLVELMVAAVLSIGIGCITLQLLLTSKKAVMQQQAQVRVHNNQTALSWMMSQAVYQAGQLPCSSLRSQLSWQLQSPELLSQLVANHGVELLEPSALREHAFFPNHWFSRLASHRPVLWLTYSQKAHALAEPYQVDDATLSVYGAGHWPKDSWMIIDDGRVVSLVQLAQEASCYLENQSCALSVKPFHPSGHLYHKGARVSLLVSNLYFLADSLRLNQDQSPIYSLYVAQLNGHTQELVEGVDDWYLDPILHKERIIGLTGKIWNHSIEPAWVSAKNRKAQGVNVRDRLLSRQSDIYWLIRAWA